MAIRRRIRERITAGLKKAGIETPILQEIPVKAVQEYSLYFEPVEVSGKLPGQAIRIPAIAYGKAYGEVAGQWYRVTFPRPIYDPTVAGIAEARKGEIPTVEAPTISIPRLEVPKVELPPIAPLTLKGFGIPHVPTSLGRFECGWAISGITDGLNDLMGVLEGVCRTVNEIIDKLVDAVVKTINDIKAVHESLRKFRDETQEALNEYNANLQATLDGFRINIEKSVNTGLSRVIPALYRAWGIPRNMAITPLHIRNVTSTGFEFQSYGSTTCYWLAVGRRR